MMITWTQVYVGKDKRLYNDRCWHGVIQLGKKKKKKKKKINDYNNNMYCTAAYMH